MRIYQLLRALAARGHRITLLVKSENEPDSPARSALEPLLEQLITIVHRRRHRYHPVSVAIATFAPYPMIVSAFGFSTRSRVMLNELLKQPWDAVQIEHSYSLQPFFEPMLREHQPFVLTEHNVESSLVVLNHYNRWFPQSAVRTLRHYDGWRFRRWERRVMRAATRVIAVTATDAQRMQAISGRAVDVVANGADVDGFASVTPAAASRRIMFIGNYGYPPNAEALSWAIHDIMPRIWQALPDARFVICGSGIRSEWPRQWNDARLEWLGYVENLASVQRSCAVFLAPLQSGGGSKLKVLEAMAAGLAVVSTSEGISGLAVQPGREFLLGTDAASLAARSIELLQQPQRVRAIGEAGRQYVQLQHAWPQLALQVESIYATLPRRQQK